MCFGSVHAWKTSARGASNVRVITNSRSGSGFALLPWAMSVLLLLRVFLCLAQIFVQSVEALRPEPPIVLHPVGHVLERSRVQTARPPLRLAPALDQPGALQHL